MYDHQTQGECFYAMLYGAVAMMSLMACCYLLFRRSNAVAPDVTSSVRLRRWTATFFACIALSHIWYLPIKRTAYSRRIRCCRRIIYFFQYSTIAVIVG